ncbi:stalk domain-containing protein [Paenibacillus sp. N3.4]|uniref:stalk domain-containing protein n=1 Tax=Paenibacillus sp. N3.4 TaxID=2603222 RepID=UPI0011C7469F|nr:stalk domain-containing protein [Paenibacillus sp. N3.4]TXK76701.1 hypothetical protein FU659_24830 [Paenibacillus sp. N3.4]
MNIKKRRILLKLVMLLTLALTYMVISGTTIQAEEGMNGWKDIAVGGSFSLGIKQDGTVWAWGENNRLGVLGNGEQGEEALNTKIPTKVSGLENVKAIAGGASRALAIKNDGTVWTWGSQKALPVQIQGLSHIVQIAGDWTHSFAIQDDGTLWECSNTPVRLEFKNVVSASSGYGNNLIVLEKDGSVWTRRSGKSLQIKELSEITKIAAGGLESYALKKDGTVWVFGSSGQGVVADKDTANAAPPRKIKDIQDVIDIQATAGGPLFLKKDRTVWASGDNRGGQLGIGSYENSDVPVQVKGVQKINKIAAQGTGFRSMALREDGTLWSWGGGYSGDGTEWYRTVPVWIKSSDSDFTPPNELISIQLDGSTLSFAQQPVIVNGTTLVPLRKIFESLGVTVYWDENTSTVTATKGKHTIILTNGNPIAKVNEQSIELETPPTVISGSILVPVRFIGESLGANVQWNPQTSTVEISTK